MVLKVAYYHARIDPFFSKRHSLTNEVARGGRPFYFRYGRTKRGFEKLWLGLETVVQFRGERGASELCVLHVRQRFSVIAHLASRCSANSYSFQLNEKTIGTMVLAERNSENVRNGRRSRGPSPNAQTESSSEEDGGITYFHLIAIDTRCPDYRSL